LASLWREAHQALKIPTHVIQEGSFPATVERVEMVMALLEDWKKTLTAQEEQERRSTSGEMITGTEDDKLLEQLIARLGNDEVARRVQQQAPSLTTLQPNSSTKLRATPSSRKTSAHTGPQEEKSATKEDSIPPSTSQKESPQKEEEKSTTRVTRSTKAKTSSSSKTSSTTSQKKRRRHGRQRWSNKPKKGGQQLEHIDLTADTKDDAEDEEDDRDYRGQGKRATSHVRGPPVGQPITKKFDGDTVGYQRYQTSGHCANCLPLHEAWSTTSPNTTLTAEIVSQWMLWTNLLYGQQLTLVRKAKGAFPEAKEYILPHPPNTTIRTYLRH
jgi:hypothetical protein